MNKTFIRVAFRLTVATVIACGVLLPASARAQESTGKIRFDATTGLAAPVWEKSGEIEVKTTIDGETSALDFDDDSTTGRLTYTASLKPLSAELQKGFALEFTSKMLSGWAHMITIMLPSSRLAFQLGGNEKEQQLVYATSEKGGSVKVAAGAFHKWKIVFHPAAASASSAAGTFDIYLDGEKKIGDLTALKGNGQALLTIGGLGPYVPPERVGRVLIENLELRSEAQSVAP